LQTKSTQIFGTSYSHLITEPDSWYVNASYRFNKWLEAGTYYNEHYANVHDRNGSLLSLSGSPPAAKSDASQKDLALSLRFDPTEWWIFKVEGHCIWGTALLQDNARNPLTERNDNPWWMLAVKTTFSF
jgi:hypothetical protein